MNFEIIATVGLVFAATTAGRIAYERRMDVLHGPYIEGRDGSDSASPPADPLRRLTDRLRWKLRGAIYLASIAA
jgi:hypothetical protein